MSEVALLWFTCKNSDCGFVPKDNQKRNKKAGVSIYHGARGRTFMKYAEGTYSYPQNGDIWFRSVKYGDILMYDANQEMSTNSYMHTIHDKEQCPTCIKRKNNEHKLFPMGAT